MSTNGLPAEWMNVPLLRKLPVAHQVFVTGFSGRTVREGKSISADHAEWPWVCRGFASLDKDST